MSDSSNEVDAWDLPVNWFPGGNNVYRKLMWRTFAQLALRSTANTDIINPTRWNAKEFDLLLKKEVNFDWSAGGQITNWLMRKRFICWLKSAGPQERVWGTLEYVEGKSGLLTSTYVVLVPKKMEMLPLFEKRQSKATISSL